MVECPQKSSPVSPSVALSFSPSLRAVSDCPWEGHEDAQDETIRQLHSLYGYASAYRLSGSHKGPKGLRSLNRSFARGEFASRAPWLCDPSILGVVWKRNLT
jgi:hypothetical protein